MDRDSARFKVDVRVQVWEEHRFRNKKVLDERLENEDLTKEKLDHIVEGVRLSVGKRSAT